MKNLLIINTSYFGDIILTSGLCQNLKLAYPDSNLVYISNKPFVDVSKYMDGVDEVWTYDKNGLHKGLLGIYKFYQEHKDKYKFDAAFVIYGNERGIILAKLLGIPKIYADNRHAYVRTFLANGKIDYKNWIHIQDKHAYLSELYSGKPIQSLKINYHVPIEATQFVNENLLKDITKPLIALNPVTKREEKDLKVDMFIELVKLIKKNHYQPVIIGNGPTGEAYFKQLPEETQKDLINFIGKTTIPQLGALLQACKVLISADTGSAHFALALDVPVVDIFYLNDRQNLITWAPKDIYKQRTVAKDNEYTAESIFQKALELINDQSF